MTSARRELIFATHLAPNIRPLYEFVVERIGAELGMPTRLVTGGSYQLIREGAVDFVFLCGLPYVNLRREDPTSVEAIAAPIVGEKRYGGRPVYFSDVIVSATSEAESFADLLGCSWAYNEPNSHSGYLITLYSLLRMGETGSFFCRTQMTGFHQESIRQVAKGAIDASAIDSQVLSVELRGDPELAERIRVIGVLGPSTIQPLVATRAVPAGLRQDVTDVVTSIGRGESERDRLATGLVDRFVPVVDASYDDIRAMRDAVEAAQLRL
jgi:phosphonate transport system substrate-binding protein